MFGDFLVGRFAQAQSDPAIATDDFLKALAAGPGNPELLQQAFIASVLSGRSEAVQLARQLPDDAMAQLLLADQEALSGNWAAAEQRYQALPQQGLTQLLRPLLVAWSQAGAGHADMALATLRPFVEGQRFRGIFALHAGMIADLAGQSAEASRYYAEAQADMPQMNLRMAQILASWEARVRPSGRGAADLCRAGDRRARHDHRPAHAGSSECRASGRPRRPTAWPRPTWPSAAPSRAGFARIRHADAAAGAGPAARTNRGAHLAADIQSNDQHPDAALQMLAVGARTTTRSPPWSACAGSASWCRLGRTDEAMQELTASPPPIRTVRCRRSSAAISCAQAAFQ